MNNPHLHVEIETTNICNTVCLHCPHDAITRPYGKMDWATYQKSIDQIIEYTPHRNFEYAGMGEPLLNPLIYQFVEYAHDQGATSLTTNASALTPQNIDRLIQSGLSHLTISFNGEDPAIYELMMGGLDFERAQRNLHTAVQMSQGTRMTVGANVSVTRQTQERLVDIRRYLNDAGIKDIYFSKCHNRGGFLKGDLVCTTPPPPVDDDRCDIFTNTLFISWSGDVLSCCHDLAGSTTLGSLNTETLHEILHKKQEIASHGVRFDICANCNDLYRYMNDRPADGREIADWVYDLYSLPNEANTHQASALSEWLYSLYSLEGQKDRFFSILSAQIELKEKQIQALEAAQQQETAVLKSKLDEILSSRSWKTIQHFQNFRLFLIPKGSRREAWFLKIINSFRS
jgi:hypothetical protein